MRSNPPYNRFKYIAKQYGKDHPEVVLATFFALADTVGIERPEREFEFARRYDFYAQSPGQEAARTILDEALIELSQDPRMQRGRDSDALWPWLARELVRMKTRLLREGMGLDWHTYASHAKGKGPALSLWQQENRIDLGRWSLPQALRELETFEVERQEVPQGEVVHQWPDGWTVQKLGPDDLEAEGEVMQHCVGDYCAEVASGDTVIYSLRDPQGRPHATMEYSPAARRFLQVYGKQNTEPKLEYARRVLDFSQAADVRPETALTDEEIQDLNWIGALLAEDAFDPSENGYMYTQHLDWRNAVLYDEEEVGRDVWGDPSALNALDEISWSLRRQALDAVEDGIQLRWLELVDEGIEALQDLASRLVDEVKEKVRDGTLEDAADVHEFVEKAYLDTDYNADYPFGHSDLEYLLGVVDENVELDPD